MLKFDFDTYTQKCISKTKKVGKTISVPLIKNKFINGKYAYYNDISEFVTKDQLVEVLSLSEYIKDNCDVFLVIGTGGSSLGSQAIIDAIKPKFKKTNPEIIYIGDDLSAINMKEVLEYIKDKEIIVNFISKSGSTMEPNVAFNIIKYIMESKYDKDQMIKRIILTTNSETGTLNKLAEEEGYRCLGIPEKIGGRFSVLTVAGLLPMAVADIDIISLIEGYNDGVEYFDLAIQYALNREVLYLQDKKVEAFIFYESKLTKFGEWLKQLFAETQGKNGKGVLPITCINTKDLHSMGQFLQDGTKMIFETAIFIENANTIKTHYNKDLNQINKIAMMQTAKAHYLSEVATNIVLLDRLDEYNLGEAIYFFMIASVAGALMINVNPLNQPGVEKYKQLIKEEL